MMRQNRISGARWRGVILLATGLTLAGGCFRNPVTLRRETRVISESGEREIGARAKDALLKEYGEFKDPVVTAYVDSIGRKIVGVSDRPNVNYEFFVLDSEFVNAFAAPGGFIFVTRGLLEQMRDEAELASVLAHEVVHVAGWHSVEMIQRQLGAGALGVIGAVAAGIALGPEALMMVSQTASLFTNLYLLGYSREHELEADRVGLRYMVSAGYDPRAALSFFQRLSELESRDGPDRWEPYLRSHPPTGARIELARAYIARHAFARRGSARNEEAYREVTLRLPRLNPEEMGRVVGNRFEQDLHGIRLAIPDGWIYEAQGPRAVVAFRRSAGEAWGELRRESAGDVASAESFAAKYAEDRKWRLIQGRQVLYPAGYAYLGQYYGAGILGGVYHWRGLFVVRDGVGWALLVASVPDRAFDSLVPSEQIFRSLTLK